MATESSKIKISVEHHSGADDNSELYLQ